MKKITLLAALLAATLCTWAQKSDDINFELGKGLNISMNNGRHNIHVGGYIQTEAIFTQIADMDDETRFGIRRSYLTFSGDFADSKFSFLLQMNFSDAYPLLDAWMAYSPVRQFKLTVGQKQTFTGTRSMMFNDMALALGSRSVADRTFFSSGRQLGLFLESRIPIACSGIDLGVAVTSGDGRNSFGASSQDYDLGGLMYGARASVYPLGFFTKGNELTDVDFARESRLKIAIGGAYSYNVGASNAIGEGHGDFTLYNDQGKAAYPDYRRMSGDLMMKYRGFTFLAEIVNATANNLGGLYTAATASSQLVPRQIADYLAIGNGVNIQAGYLFPKLWAVDVRYSTISPEFGDHQTILHRSSTISGGVAKYFIDNRLKIQLAGAYTDFPDMTVNNKQLSLELTAHVVF